MRVRRRTCRHWQRERESVPVCQNSGIGRALHPQSFPHSPPPRSPTPPEVLDADLAAIEELENRPPSPKSPNPLASSSNTGTSKEYALPRQGLLQGHRSWSWRGTEGSTKNRMHCMCVKMNMSHAHLYIPSCSRCPFQGQHRRGRLGRRASHATVSASQPDCP